ncbi:MAG: FAD:protein FMN transferase [Ruminococcaceae bacterium]|nr:FAD:protein FMN transferase [Oscillospiraceae bacterium]
MLNINSERNGFMIKTKLAVRLIAAFTVFSVICAFFSGCSDKYTEFTSFSMGSVLTARIYTDDSVEAENLREAINTACEEADNALSSTDKDAEIYHLNHNKRIIASEFLKNTLMDIIMVSNTLERKVDVSVGEITKLWGFTSSEPSVPEKNALDSAVKARDIEKILIDTDSTMIIIEDDISLDTGAFGKGVACDAAFESIKNATSPLIMTLGGTVMAFGEGPSKGKWTVGIRNPFDSADSYFATLKLAPLSPKNAVFVSTSGSYEKTFTENSVTYHHILDPETGYPVDNGLVSVTVIAHSGLNADALSTALFVNGFNDDALQLLKSFSAEAVFVFSDGSYYVTQGLTQSFTLTDDSFTLKEYAQ